MKTSQVAQRTINPIRAIVDVSLEEKKEKIINKNNDSIIMNSSISSPTSSPTSIPSLVSKPLISLSIGDPTVYFETHPNVLIAIKNQLSIPENLHLITGYPPAVGLLSARKAIAQKYSLDDVCLTWENVVITSGCSGALDLAISVLADPSLPLEESCLDSSCQSCNSSSNSNSNSNSNSLLNDCSFKDLKMETATETATKMENKTEIKTEMEMEAKCNFKRNNLGDAILLPVPGFSLYRVLCKSKGIRIVDYDLIPEKNWEINLDQVEGELKRNGGRIKGWLINNPSNPCGSNYKRAHLEDCVSLAMKYSIPIIADEIYDSLCWTPFHSIRQVAVSMGKLENCNQVSIPILTCSGLAKKFLVPGWRVGWIITTSSASTSTSTPSTSTPSTFTCKPLSDSSGPMESSSSMTKEINQGLTNLAGLVLGANSLIQAAIPDLFTTIPDEWFDGITMTLKSNSEIIYKILSGTNGLCAILPQGTMYMMIGIDTEILNFKDDVEFMRLLDREENVKILAGSVFGMKNYFRIIFCAEMNILDEACRRIASFCTRHLRKLTN